MSPTLVGALAAEQQHACHVGQAHLRLPGADLLRRHRRAAAGLEIDVDAGLFIETHLLRIEVRRMIAARDPVERGDLVPPTGAAPSATPASAATANFAMVCMLNSKG